VETSIIPGFSTHNCFSPVRGALEGYAPIVYMKVCEILERGGVIDLVSMDKDQLCRISLELR